MKLERPPYFLAHPADASGCGFHRIARPLDVMAKHGYAAGRSEFQFIPDHLLKALRPDVVVWQRQGEKHQIEVMKKYREILPKSFFVYEVDDALSAVPDKSWHKPFMPSNIDVGVKEGAAVCDLITVSTHDLARHMRSLCGDVEVRVVPNMLGLTEFEIAHQIRLQAGNAPKKKFRIGWGGGAGHGGDFDQIQSVFKYFGMRIEWVFLGFKPEIPDGIDAAFAGATNPTGYTGALANLNCDLMIAPLEDNLFNRCKSNLRMIEAGACSFPVIASPVTPYLEANPPVYGYAKTSDEWIDLIEKFMALPDSQRADHGRKMRSWARNNFCLDDKIQKRTEGWLPTGTKAFTPHVNDGTSAGIVVLSDSKKIEFDDQFARASTFTEACRSYRGDILYVRDTLIPPKDLLGRIEKTQLRQASTVSFLSNDGGSVGFPKTQTFTGIDPYTAQSVDAAAVDLIDSGENTQPCNIGYASGSAILIRRAALDLVGFPDFTINDTEIAIIEWSAAAAARGFQNVVYFGAYLFAEKTKSIAEAEAAEAALRMGIRWPQPAVENDKIAIAREKLDLHYHRGHYRGLPPANRNDYSAWAMFYDTPSEMLMAEYEKWMASRPTLRITQSMHGVGQSYYDTLLSVADSESDWILCHDHKTKIDDYYPAFLSKAIEEHPEAVVIYCDSDRMAPNGTRLDHDFKPDFDHHLFLCRDYVTQAVAIRRDVLKTLLESADKSLEGDCLLYAMILDVVATGNRDKAIAHIQRVLCHLTSVDPNVLRKKAQKKAELANSHVQQLGWSRSSVKHHPAILDGAELRYFDADSAKWDDKAPLVSIIVPTKNKVEMLEPCLNTLLSMTTYPNFKILVVDNGSTRQEMLDYQATINDPRVTLIRWPEPYNWSKLNNYATENTDGEFFCFLNDDTRVLSPGWLDEMMAAAMLPNVCAVGARLLYPGNAVQHIGVVSHKTCNGHLHKGMAAHLPGYHGIAFLSHESTCVTGACLVVRRSIFEEIGRFPEFLSHNFNDVAFCLDARRKGYINIVAARAELQHFESVTRPYANSEEGRRFMLAERDKMSELYTEADPYWNPNLSIFAIQDGMMIVGLNCDTPHWPALPWPWRDPAKPFERILVVGKEQSFVDELRNGDSLYELAISGYESKIAKPPIENCKPFDARDARHMKEALSAIGIDRIIIGTIGDAFQVHLAALAGLGLPIEYRPIDAESVCPRHTLKPNGLYCDHGWMNAKCQSCIDQNGSQHGPVGIMSWLGEWVRFMSNPNVTIDLSYLEQDEYAKAIKQIYGEGGLIAKPPTASGEKDNENIQSA